MSMKIDGVEIDIEQRDGVFIASSGDMPEICVCHPDRQAILDDLPSVIAAVKADRASKTTS